MLEILESRFEQGEMHFYMWNDISLELLDFAFKESFGYAENIHEAKTKIKKHLAGIPERIEY